MSNFSTKSKKFFLYAFLGAISSLLSMNVYAQTGPAGVGNKDGSSGQPQLEIWIDASDISLSNDDPIDSWSDKSGNSIVLSQSGTARPTFKTSADANYNFSSARFDGSDDQMPFDGNILVGTDYTVIAVAARRSNGRNVIFGGSTASSNQNFHPYFNTSNLHSHHYGNDHNAAYTGGAGSTVNATTPDFGVFTFSLDAALGADNRKMYQNGSLIGTRSNDARLSSFVGASLGYYDRSADFSTLDLAELIVFSEALTAPQLTIINNYLSSKYNLAMDANDFYAGDTPANGNFDFNVRGVGKDNSLQVTTSNASGFYVDANSSLNLDGEFLLFGDDATTNAVSTSNLGASVQARWLKTWYVDKSTVDGLGATISFDFIEGISGDYPAGTTDNYVLLRNNGGVYDIVNIASVNKSVVGSKVSFIVADTDLIDGEYTLGTTNSTDSPVDGQPNQTWYSYKTTGNWSDPLTWTTDGSGFDRIPAGGGIPDATDNVVILSGKNVIMDINDVVIASFEVNGLIDLGASSGHNFVNISGNGKVRLSGNGGVGNFPAGSTTTFADNFLGGTVEYYGTGLSIVEDRLYNNVEINLSTATDELVLLNDIQINGDFTITSGVFKINDNTATQILTLDLYGDTFVDSNGTIAVGQGNTIGSYSIGGTMPSTGNYHSIYHQVNIYGNLTNQGSIRFTNETSPIYDQFSALGAASVYFKGATNNVASLFGNTDFYNIIVDKGTDQTFEIEINSTNTSNFGLYGANSVGRVSNNGFTAENPEVRKALWIRNGTLHLTGSLEIPTLSEGNDVSGNGDYPIGANGGLWIDGANVAVYSTADDASEAPVGASGINGGGSNQALSLYGDFRISDGHFGTRGSAGFIFWNASAGEVLIEGGTINVSQFRSAQSGTGTFTYTQSGGDVLVRANEGRAGETSGTYDLFSLDLPEAVFNMSGGTLTVYGNRGDAIFINSKIGNYSVTGGTVIVENRDNDIATIASTVPFWNLTVSKDQAGDASEIDLITCTSGVNTITDPSLVVLHDFIIDSDITFDHNGNDVTIGSDFRILSGADYVYDVAKPNTTLINGNAVSVLDFSALVTFNNFEINKSSASLLIEIDNGAATAIQVNGNFRLESGTLDYKTFNIHASADIYISDTLGLAGSTGRLVLDGAAQQELVSEGGVIASLEIDNSNGINLLNGDLVIFETLTLTDGVFDINTSKLTMAGASANISGTFSSTVMIQTSGNVSDGGLEMYLDTNETLTFPIGTDANSDIRYTPLVAVYSSFSDDGYIRVNPADQVLPTTNGNGGTMLSYYWRVSHTGFTTVPKVTSYTFSGSENDDGTGSSASFPNSWRGGKVLSEVPFTRTSEDNSSINNPTGHDINFDGDGTPFDVENADYSAGPPNRFNGTPLVYYTKGRDRTGTQPLWTSANTWTRSDRAGFDPTNPHSSSNPDSPDAPGVGDIVNIGFFPYDDPQVAYRGYPHSARINSGDLEAGVLIFTQMTDEFGNAPVERKPISDIGGPNDFQFRPTLTWNSTGSILITSIQGEGTIRVRGGSTNNNQRDPSFASVDLGLFVNQDSSYVLYEAFNDFTITNVPNVVPNLTITNDGWGANDRNVTITKSFTTNQNLEIQGNSNLLLGNGATGDITIGNNLYLRPLANGTGGGELRFPNSGTARNIIVEGNVFVGDPIGAAGSGGNIIRVEGGGTVSHQMDVYGDIIINTTGSNGGNGNGLKFGDGTASVVDVTLKGESSNTLENVSGDTPQFHRLILDKGNDATNSFTLNTNISLTGAANTSAKAIDLLNGSLIFNDALIDVNLTTGGANFNIPATSSLQLTNGTVRASGDDTGIYLDGALIIDGGNAYLNGAGNGNNYIEYSASGTATLDISSGNLLLGSQIRRNTITAEGKLNYTQTGGTVVLGQNAAPESSRGVLEVVNTGSNFTYTGGTLTLVRQNTASPNVAALRLLPTSYNVSETIFIGNGSTPVSQNNFGINSNIPLAGLTISGVNSPTATLQINALTLNGELLINSGAAFNANGIGLNLNNDFTNDGTFIPSANLTTFNSTGTQNLQGSGSSSFYQFTKLGSGQLEILDSDITIHNLFTFSEGIINDNGNTIDIKGNAVLDGEHLSSGAGDGFKFSSSSAQQLSRSTNGATTLGIVTITNPTGLVIPEAGGYDFLIEGALRMNGGVFNIGGSAITLGQSANVTTSSSFSVSNMVKTNSSFSDNGLTKVFSPGYNQVFTFPIGEEFYTPVIADLSIGGGTSGSSVGSISAKPANEYHPTVLSGGDINNVLQYYWTLKSTGLNNFKGDVIFNYDQSDVSVTGANTEADYIAARILNFNNPTNDINKYSADDLVDESTNTMNFNNTLVFDGVSSNSIAGDYFAGIDAAIPANVATYTSTGTGGFVGDDATYVESLPTPGTPPSGAILVVSNGTEVNFNQTGVRLYKTIIEPGGVLNIDNTEGHRLGILEGTGTLKITSNTTNAPLPAADYGTFFSCTGGGLEYAGTGDYNVLPGISSVRNLTFSDPTGTGIRNFPNNDVTVCEDLVVNGPEVKLSSNRTVNIEGDVIIQDGDFTLANGSSSRVFVDGDMNINGGNLNGALSGGIGIFGDLIINGGTYNMGFGSHFITIRQNFELISGAINSQNSNVTANSNSFQQYFIGDFTGTNKFYNLTIDNRNGSQDFHLNGTLEVSNILYFNDGKFVSVGSSELKFNSTGVASPSNGKVNSYFTGKITKDIASAGGNFSFPIGSGNEWRPAVVKNVSNAGLTWEAQYFSGSVIDNTIVTNSDPTDPAAIDRIQIGEYWVVSDGATAPPGVTATVGLSWGQETDVSANSSERQELQVMVWNAGASSWDNKGGGTFSAGNSQSQGTFEATSSVTFSENIFAVGSGDPSNPLPVELISFEAIPNSSSVTLLWSTASEINNDFFEIQRSFDGTTFETIGLVEGSGSVLYQIDYDFIDMTPLNGKSYYRLKQNDYDGNFEYSEIISVTIEVASNLKLNPNPTTDQAIYLTLEGFHSQQNVEVKIFNLQGRTVFQKVLSPDDIYRKALPVRQVLNPGIYILEVNQGSTSKQVRLAIQ